MQPSLPKKEHIQSVGQLTASIKRTLEDQFATAWVKGEVSNLRYQSSGHIYFSLKDDRAQVSAVMFKGNASRLGFKLKDGMEVIVFGNISVYEPRGSYQLIVRHCIEEGAGRLQVEFERLKQKLNEEGLFDASQKKRLPILPRRIGIITSPTGAALRDFLSILSRREWTGEVVIFPAVVQGIDGAASLLKQLALVEDYGQLDILVIGRGGGSLEDLWNFNEEAVVRAVSSCSVPTISAVGHEIDFVLTDFSADKRAETPSAAAELITSGYVDALSRLKTAKQDLVRAGSDYFERSSSHLKYLSERLRSVAPNRVLENRQIRLDDLQERLRSRLHEKLAYSNTSFEFQKQRFTAIQPALRIQRQQDHLFQLNERLKKEYKHQLSVEKNKMVSLGKRLNSLSVDQVLHRGFAITSDSKGNVITSSKKLKHGNTIITRFKDGDVRSFVDASEQLDLFGDPTK